MTLKSVFPAGGGTSGSGDAYGFYAWVDGSGDTNITSSGDITANVFGVSGDAYGMNAWARGDGDITITSDGDIEAHVASGGGEERSSCVPVAEA